MHKELVVQIAVSILQLWQQYAAMLLAQVVFMLTQILVILALLDIIIKLILALVLNYF